MPRPTEYQTLVRHQLAIDAADLMLLTGVGSKAQAIAAADFRIDLRFDRARHDIRRSKPARYFFRIGPRRPDFFGRGLEPAREREARSRRGAGVSGGG